jgi:hypothetical protein
MEARVQGCVTGETAHDVHALLANYELLCLLAREDESALARCRAIEQRLRTFCQTCVLPCRLQTSDVLDLRKSG